MNMTEFWFKLIDITKSDASALSLGGISISEKQVFWIVVIAIGILALLLLRNAVRWVLGASDKSKGEKAEQNTKKTSEALATPPVAPVDVAKTVPPENKTDASTTTPAPTSATTTPPTATAKELLTDTSDRKRSLNDFVTPDTIHTDVTKQTLNNDFPYQTMKPDASKIGQEAPVTSVSTSVAPPVSEVATVTVPIETPKVVDPSLPEETKPIAPTETVLPPATTPPVTTTPDVVIPIPATPLVTEVAQSAPVVSPSAVATPDVTTPIVASPAVATPAVASPTVASPVATTPVVATPIATTPVDATTTIPPTAGPPTPSVAPTKGFSLPPLPAKTPDTNMVVGVADETKQPIKTTTFNPTDPIIP